MVRSRTDRHIRALLLCGLLAHLHCASETGGKTPPGYLVDPKLPWAIVARDVPREPTTGLPRLVLDPKTGIVLVLVEPGEFMCGASPGDSQAEEGLETPRHLVKIEHPFYLGKYEVTEEEWARVMRCDPSSFGPKYPVMGVKRREVSAFLSRTGLRLPREEEWEYACRAGDERPRYGDLWDIARHLRNSGDCVDGCFGPSEVGSYLPNALGLYDMLGNVEELCQGAYAAYRTGEVVVGKAPDDSVLGVKRGGGFLTSSHLCRASSRRPYMEIDEDLIVLGFRVARDP